MSTSSVSIIPVDGGGFVTRRRAVDGSLRLSEIAKAEFTSTNETPVVVSRESEMNSPRSVAKNSGHNRKSKKQRWLTVIRVFTKIMVLIIVLLGFLQMMVWLKGGVGVGDFSFTFPGYSDGELSEMKRFVKKTVNALQVQVNAIEGKLDNRISSVRKELNEQIAKKGKQTDLKLKSLEARNDAFEKFMNNFKSKNLLSKEEFDHFMEEFRKARMNAEVTLDDILAYARGVVKTELEKHSADGLGMVDYALASGGGKVVKHSEPYGRSSFWLVNLNKISSEADRMLKPSFGEPGQCFPIKGSGGFIEIRLGAAIIPEAVTLEHVAKSVAFDRSSAPKNCRVSGWFQGQNLADSVDDTKKFPLLKFTYDLDKSNAQTFKVEMPLSIIIDTIRLDILSNHGSTSHTCIYRFRVHGREPTANPASKRTRCSSNHS